MSLNWKGKKTSIVVYKKDSDWGALASLPALGIWQCLEAFLLVTAVGGATGIEWREARDAAIYPTVYSSALYNKKLFTQY